MDPFRESLSVLEGAVSAEHPVPIPLLNNVATSLVKLGRREEAASAYLRAVAICGKTLGDHAICGTVFGNYALLLRKLGRKREAKEMAAHSRQIEMASERRNGVGSVVSLESLRSDAN